MSKSQHYHNLVQLQKPNQTLQLKSIQISLTQGLPVVTLNHTYTYRACSLQLGQSPWPHKWLNIVYKRITGLKSLLNCGNRIMETITSLKSTLNLMYKEIARRSNVLF